MNAGLVLRRCLCLRNRSRGGLLGLFKMSSSTKPRLSCSTHHSHSTPFVDYRRQKHPNSVFYSRQIEGQARAREIDSLVKLAAVQDDMRCFVIVTKQESETIETGGITIEVIPAWKFLLQDPSLMGE